MHGSASAADDARYMKRALELAALGLVTTDPNPRVGCVIVLDGKIIGEGWHERAGEAHAEVRALEAAGQQAERATVYVTLEPCSHFGRTPPCADALIRARVARVVHAMEDPNPLVEGRGIARLRAAGIEVDQGPGAAEAGALNPGFIKRMRTGLPFVRIKLAMSLDGRTALANGRSQWITGEAAREDVQRLRARSSAVVTGIRTILADDPRLTVRQQATGARQPTRVILDSNWQTPGTARVLADVAPVVIFGAPSSAGQTKLAERPGIQLIAEDPHDLPAVLATLGKMSFNEVLVESGPTLAGAFLGAGLADELIVYIAPMLLGDDARPMAKLPSLHQLADARLFEILESTKIGRDLRLTLRPRVTGQV